MPLLQIRPVVIKLYSHLMPSTKRDELHSTLRSATSPNRHLAYHFRKGQAPMEWIRWTRAISPIKAPRSSSWKRIRPMDSTPHLRDSPTWKRCRKWERYRVPALISMISKMQAQYALLLKHQHLELHLPWLSRAWIQSPQPVEGHSSDNNPAVWVPALRPAPLLPPTLQEQRAHLCRGSRTSPPLEAQCSRIRPAVRTLDITCQRTPTIQSFWRTWGQAPISSPSRHFSKEASMQACPQVNSIDAPNLTT